MVSNSAKRRSLFTYSDDYYLSERSPLLLNSIQESGDKIKLKFHGSSSIKDCQVCCRPNVLYVYVDEDTLDIQIDTDYEE